MAKKGIVYVMSCTQGLLKIGCTQTEQFENRMKNLESNGYKQFNGFKREFAVEVEDYQSKESLMHRLFDKSQVKLNGKGIEMFATDLDLVKDLMRAFGGKQIYPKPKAEVADIVQTQAPKPKAKRLSFKELNIPKGSELHYTIDNSITAITADDVNKVSYQGKEYSLSGLVKYLKHGGSWQGGCYFTYQGKTLVKIREEIANNGKD